MRMSNQPKPTLLTQRHRSKVSPNEALKGIAAIITITNAFHNYLSTTVFPTVPKNNIAYELSHVDSSVHFLDESRNQKALTVMS